MKNYTKLLSLLKEIFQINQTNWDFGCYKIINQKREEIEQFLEIELLQKIKDAKEQLGGKAIGLDKKEIRPKLEAEIIAQLLSFFKYYYRKGKFFPHANTTQKSKYYISSNGEATQFYWANQNQYYIKTSDYLKNYQFKLDGNRRLRFELIEDNSFKTNTMLSGKQRQYRIYEARPFEIQDDTLIVYFTYLPSEKRTKQTTLNAFALKIINTQLPSEWQKSILQSKGTDKKSDKNLLEKHIDNFTHFYTPASFIHKDLGAFLRQELDFYANNELERIVDIDAQKPQKMIQGFLLIKTLKTIAHQIIYLLEQLENYRKNFWLKKKFIVASNYCLSLDKIPPSYYPEIAKNEAQWKAWESLFAINDLIKESNATVYANRMALLKDQAFLVLDTCFFSTDFKDRLLGEFDHLEEQTDGLLIHAENFQALQLLQEKYKTAVDCIYIDPPYNTGGHKFPYKDSFQTSAWLSMMQDRIRLSWNLLADSGLFAANIDEHECESLDYLIRNIFGKKNHLGKIIWDKRNPKGDAKGIAVQHEYILVAAKNYLEHKNKALWFKRNKENATKIRQKAATLIKKAGRVNDAVRKEFKQWMRQQAFSGGEKAYAFIDDEGEVYRPVSMSWPNKKKAPDEYFIPLIHPITKKACPLPRRGWRNPPETMQKLLERGEILFGKDETTQPTRKYLLKNNLLEGVPSLFYFAGSDDDFFKNLGLYFDNPKPLQEAKYITSICARNKNSLVVDFFAGSATTAHAVIDLNRADKGQRKYILIEMEHYFESLTKARLQKIIYSKDWKDGKPLSRKGSSHIFKYIQLESYEDTFNNLAFPKQQKSFQAQAKIEKKQTLCSISLSLQDNILSYKLDTLQQSDELIHNGFIHPFNCQLLINQYNKPQTCKVDLVETFNYLIGLKVNSLKTIEGFRIVTGTKRTGETSLVIWRDFEEKSNSSLLTFLEKQFKSRLEKEFQHIYVNGKNTVATLQKELNGNWQCYSIEEVFLQKMFCKM